MTIPELVDELRRIAKHAGNQYTTRKHAPYSSADVLREAADKLEQLGRIKGGNISLRDGLTIGGAVFLVHHPRSGPAVKGDAVVKYIGPTYAHALWHGQQVRFHLDTGLSTSDCSPDFKAYLHESDYISEQMNRQVQCQPFGVGTRRQSSRR